jgi:hypothetical protein
VHQSLVVVRRITQYRTQTSAPVGCPVTVWVFPEPGRNTHVLGPTGSVLTCAWNFGRPVPVSWATTRN